MANESNNRGIKKSWSLLAFVKAYGQPRYVDDFKAEDGSTFCALSFSADRFDTDQLRTYTAKDGSTALSNYCMVSFSQKLSEDETTMEAIANNVDELQVVELQRDAEHPYASFKLCRKGEYQERGTAMNLH